MIINTHCNKHYTETIYSDVFSFAPESNCEWASKGGKQFSSSIIVSYLVRRELYSLSITSQLILNIFSSPVGHFRNVDCTVMNLVCYIQARGPSLAAWHDEGSWTGGQSCEQTQIGLCCLSVLHLRLLGSETTDSS